MVLGIADLAQSQTIEPLHIRIRRVIALTIIVHNITEAVNLIAIEIRDNVALTGASVHL